MERGGKTASESRIGSVCAIPRGTCRLETNMRCASDVQRRTTGVATKTEGEAAGQATPQTPAEPEISVQLSQHVILSPFAAKLPAS